MERLDYLDSFTMLQVKICIFFSFYLHEVNGSVISVKLDSHEVHLRPMMSAISVDENVLELS